VYGRALRVPVLALRALKLFPHCIRCYVGARIARLVVINRRQTQPKEEFRVAVNTLSGISKSREEQIRYISRLKFQKDFTHSLSTAEKKGFTEAILQTALNFLKLGLTDEQVAAGTNLSLSEIEELKKQL
jgi:hypothetical protein